MSVPNKKIRRKNPISQPQSSEKLDWIPNTAMPYSLRSRTTQQAHETATSTFSKEETFRPKISVKPRPKTSNFLKRTCWDASNTYIPTRKIELFERQVEQPNNALVELLDAVFNPSHRIGFFLLVSVTLGALLLISLSAIPRGVLPFTTPRCRPGVPFVPNLSGLAMPPASEFQSLAASGYDVIDRVPFVQKLTEPYGEELWQIFTSIFKDAGTYYNQLLESYDAAYSCTKQVQKQLYTTLSPNCSGTGGFFSLLNSWNSGDVSKMKSSIDSCRDCVRRALSTTDNASRYFCPWNKFDPGYSIEAKITYDAQPADQIRAKLSRVIARQVIPKLGDKLIHCQEKTLRVEKFLEQLNQIFRGLPWFWRQSSLSEMYLKKMSELLPPKEFDAFASCRQRIHV
jgi:hypothetical protein